MKKTIIYAAGVIALTISAAFTVAVSNATTTQHETPSAVLAADTELSKQSTNTLDSKNQTVYVITNSDGTANKSFIGSRLNTSSEPMPLEQHITYTLDGQEISAEDLIGKSGHVKITFAYTATKTYQNKLVPFLVTAGFTLDDAKFKNVKIDNGRVLSESDDIIAAGYCFAGLNEDLNTDLLPSSFTVTADVTNFTLDNVYTFATNEIFAEIDTSKLNSIDSIIGSINELSDGLDRIVSGSNDLSNGLDSALVGANKLQSGAIKLETGASTLANGATKLSNGTAELSTGINEVNTGASTIAEKTSLLNENIATLSENSTTLYNGFNQIFTALLNSTGAKIGQELTSENFDNVLDYIISILPPTDPTKAELMQTKVLLDNYSALLQGLDKYTTGLDTIASLTPALNEGTTALANGTNTLILSGASTLANGAKDLANGTNTLASGTTELRSGVDTLTSGILQLSNGSKTLTAGLITFKQQGINRLVDFANNDLDSFIRNFRATITAADSYHHYGDSNATSVKFIFKSPSLK